ncbi:MAG: endonuclease/exonuclease/phosphatase family protein [Acidobacteriota bacterium]
MHLRVVTYNIHRAIGVDRRYRLDRIVDILRHHRPDIALLQEVDDGAPRSRHQDMAQELADRLEYPEFAVGHNVSLREGRYGNATLSRFPIVLERNVDLTMGRRKARGCQYVRLQLAPNLPQLDVFNLHLGLSAAERKKQIERLVRSVELLRVPDHAPCVVGGDFNDWRTQLGPILRDRQGFRSATERRRAGSELRTYPSFSPSTGLDRVYYRGPLKLHASRRCRLKLSKVASDHLPVIVDFEVDTSSRNGLPIP